MLRWEKQIKKFLRMTYKLLQVVLLCLSSSVIYEGFKLSEAHNIAAMYVFGDSLVDVGNNNYLLFSFNKANFPHNGIDYPFSKATGRFGNGKNTADFLGNYNYIQNQYFSYIWVRGSYSFVFTLWYTHFSKIYYH